MNSEGVSHEELVETGQAEVYAVGNRSSKIVPDSKSGLEKRSTEPVQENKEHTFHLPEIFSLDRPFSNNKNDKDNSHEESKYNQMKVKSSPQECEDTVISKDKATAKDKDCPGQEIKSEENYQKKELEEEKISKPSAQVDECYYLNLKDGHFFKIDESSYNLRTCDLYLGSKVRLALGENLIDNISIDTDFPDYPEVTTEDTNELGYNKVKIVDAIILPLLEAIDYTWNGEMDSARSMFGDD
jgi:hypothetical protein